MKHSSAGWPIWARTADRQRNIQRMAYSSSFVREQLAAISSNLPRAMGLSTDVVHNPQKNSSYEAVIISRHGGGIAKIDIRKRANEPNRVVDQLRKSFGVSEEAAGAIKEAALRLFAVNPQGSWCVAPVPSQVPRVLAAYPHLDVLEQSEYATRVVDRLAELLPIVAKIVADKNTTSPAGGGRVVWRTWLRFLDMGGMEVAAIDTSTLQIHAKDALTHGRHDHLEINLHRLLYWVKQLGVVTTDLEQGTDRDLALVHASGELLSQLNAAFVTSLGADEVWLCPERP